VPGLFGRCWRGVRSCRVSVSREMDCGAPFDSFSINAEFRDTQPFYCGFSAGVVRDRPIGPRPIGVVFGVVALSQFAAGDRSQSRRSDRRDAPGSFHPKAIHHPIGGALRSALRFYPFSLPVNTSQPRRLDRRGAPVSFSARLGIKRIRNSIK
jgi:hypothetical protein